MFQVITTEILGFMEVEHLNLRAWEVHGIIHNIWGIQDICLSFHSKL